MKKITKRNLFSKHEPTKVNLSIVPNVEVYLLIQRKINASKLLDDCEKFISTKKVPDELQERNNALKTHDKNLSTLEAVVTLLDYVEREKIAIEKLEMNKINFFSRFRKFMMKLFVVFE